METVNVDIRKLQLLNDRINQTIDALNQVRLSVHGLQHTQQNIPWGYGANLPVGQVPVGTIPSGGVPVSPFGYGISHTMQDPRLAGVVGDPRLQDPRFLASGLPVVGFGGLTHSIDPMMDPYWRQRMLQTFPYMTSPYAPIF